MEQLVIYKLGETHLQTTIANGYADYTERPEAYLNELGPGYTCLPIDQADGSFLLLGGLRGLVILWPHKLK